MQKKGYIKKMFPGGNTSLGFYSYFEYVIDTKKAEKIYYLKGGPGLGKSYMMKKIAYELIEKGIDLEFHHCSADPESIDALVIPSLKVAIIDGTSPHTLDPRYPGVTGTIINLGKSLNEESLRKDMDNIIGATDYNKDIYIRIYKYLKAAKLIHDDIEWINGNAINFIKVNKETNIIINKHINSAKNKNRIGKQRHLFGSAYTLKGHIDFIESLMDIVDNIIFIKGVEGTGKSTMLKKIGKSALEKGYDVETYHEPLVPTKAESIIIPELNIAFTTNKKYKDKNTVDLDQYIDKEKIEKYKEELIHSYDTFGKLMDYVYKNLNKTNSVHDEIEGYYSPNISYEKLDEIRQKILKEIIENIST